MRNPPILLLSLLLLGGGCAARPIHPGAVDSADSKAYDSLLVAQTILDTAKAQIESGKLPATAKPVVNRGGEAYNVARTAWLAYRGTAPALRSGNSVAMVEALAKLDGVVKELKALIGGVK